MTKTENAPTQAALSFAGRNPDVLTCIANLSNDEVFTPPELANQMLDVLEQAWADSNDGASIWSDSTVKFLDPFTKSGVFLREITKRLVDGLAEQIPDLSDRVDHILTKQVYGVGITELTALLARRSLYCSKWADGKHSVAKSFTNPDGNIWFERTEHTWIGGTKVLTADKKGKQVEAIRGGKCKFCGTGQTTLDRGEDLESHAYAFIHTDDIKTRITELFGDDMQFDVIIGNPPYQLDDGGFGASAAPIFHRFVEQAKLLEPRFLTVVIPSRWFAGGKGLDEFRQMMLTDGQLSMIHDFPETTSVFPGVNIRGGVCVVLCSSERSVDVQVVSHAASSITTMKRPALEPGLSTFIRFNDGISILRKVRALNEPTMETMVSSRNPFGLPTNFDGFTIIEKPDSVRLYRSNRGEHAGRAAFIKLNDIPSSQNLVHKHKVLILRASPGGDEIPHMILSRPLVVAGPSASTDTYLVAGAFDSEVDANNLSSYLSTRFARFLVSLSKSSQNIPRGAFALVPAQDSSRPWTDEELYEKYGITEDEQAFIESMIRPMGLPEEAEK